MEVALGIREEEYVRPPADEAERKEREIKAAARKRRHDLKPDTRTAKRSAE